MDLLQLAVIENGNWRLGIGDPTPVGWITAISYFVAAITCAFVWVAEQRRARNNPSASPHFWMMLTLLLLVLGINKQLDIQTLFTDVGRHMAKAEGWYEQRRFYQKIFIGTVCLGGLGAVCGLGWLARRQWTDNLLALAGTVFLYVFVLIRAASFHHVDALLRSELFGWRWNWILELSGIGMVLIGAAVKQRRFDCIK